MSERPFDEAEAARRLGISRGTLIAARKRGTVTPMRIGKAIIRYTDEDLAQYRRACPTRIADILRKASECRTPLIREPGIYLLYRGDAIVYVGKTTNFSGRLASHMFRKEFDAYSFLAAPLDELDELEARLIDHLRPPLNVAMNADRFTKRRTR